MWKRGKSRARDAKKDCCCVRMPVALLVAECRCSSLYLNRYRSMQGSVQHFCLLTHAQIRSAPAIKQIWRDVLPRGCDADSPAVASSGMCAGDGGGRGWSQRSPPEQGAPTSEMKSPSSWLWLDVGQKGIMEYRLLDGDTVPGWVRERGRGWCGEGRGGVEQGTARIEEDQPGSSGNRAW